MLFMGNDWPGFLLANVFSCVIKIGYDRRMASVNDIRRIFLEFFEKQGHQIVSSAPLIPHQDPTLMFTNAGMVPFKNVFTAQETRDYKRATSSQKCVRAGGKHNDLDNVGYTARHHTFFEMLGNFSFGDYFKEKAIYYAWELLTKEFHIPKERMLVTVYHTDDEALALWKKIAGISEDRIIRIEGADNFWSMGDTGPCGPCSEIFYDHGEKIAGGPPGSKDADGDRFVEIWNLVFMQYEMLVSGERLNLPAPSIDTGMGLERVAAVLQNVHDNYDIDLFQALINQSKFLSGNHDSSAHNAHRVIADHLRSSAFLLADGVMPSNEGRGYVLRRIMRRSMRYVRQIGCKEPLMYQLVPTLIEQMGAAYPELIRAKALITEILKVEEENFSETLDRGIKLLEKETDALGAGDKLSGETAFKLYDTYGFPYDLTVDILRTREIGVDEEGFKYAMNEQKQRAKAAWKGSGEHATEELWYELKEQHGATEFLGYSALEGQGKVIAIINQAGQLVENTPSNEECFIVLNQTPFYGESGGQEGDRGLLLAGGIEAQVLDTKKYLGLIHAHRVKLNKGSLSQGQVVTARVDNIRRLKLRANHTATHILHAVLREVLGGHVTQKGSLVAEDRLRFDISHPRALSSEEVQQIEQKVNQIIRHNSEVDTALMEPEDAIEAGALALFGEKYGDEVRVLSLGKAFQQEKAYSVELCGGTHVERTGDIGLFKMINESAVAAGIRRIEALTGEEAVAYVQSIESSLQGLAAQLKIPVEQITTRVDILLKERKELEKELSKARQNAAMGGSNFNSSEVEEINGISLLAKILKDISPKDLRALVMESQQKIGSGVVALASSFEGKSSLIISVSDDITNRVSAVDLVKKAAPFLGAAGGGGKPNFAQTGGADISQLDALITEIRASLAS